MMGSDVLDLEDVPAEVRLQWIERRELFRRAAQSVVDQAETGRVVDPHTLAWAQQIVRNIMPLGRPLTDGALRCCYCGMEGHLSKDCPKPRGNKA